ncbi:MAG: hypothetical protein COW30_14615 [Rhodospirillales bacterium CG15_BIG_FIL_POST_REV_8_21_14_020_66_15]|nr:MAG: hypothetical protein COW30_14615 [Rhodospirillales bacterium CG15_BIG_FIL_POST_REV_8_21_14_020_66_15]
MPLWRLTPVARLDDPRWLDHPVWADVVVRAPTAGAAIHEAERMALEDAGGAMPMGNESLTFQSGFRDEKLYAVRRLDPVAEPALSPEGATEVLRAVKR